MGCDQKSSSSIGASKSVNKDEPITILLQSSEFFIKQTTRVFRDDT